MEDNLYHNLLVLFFGTASFILYALVPFLHVLRILRAGKERGVPFTSLIPECLVVIFRDIFIAVIILYFIEIAGYPVSDYISEFWGYLDKVDDIVFNTFDSKEGF